MSMKCACASRHPDSCPTRFAWLHRRPWVHAPFQGGSHRAHAPPHCRPCDTYRHTRHDTPRMCARINPPLPAFRRGEICCPSRPLLWRARSTRSARCMIARRPTAVAARTERPPTSPRAEANRGCGREAGGSRRVAHLYRAAVGLEGEALEVLPFSLHQRRQLREHHGGHAARPTFVFRTFRTGGRCGGRWWEHGPAASSAVVRPCAQLQ